MWVTETTDAAYNGMSELVRDAVGDVQNATGLCREDQQKTR